MLKSSITPQDVCDLLNEMLKLDYGCLQSLILHRAFCNRSIAEHPTIQVRQYPTDKFPSVGLMGVLNGLFGVREDGMGAICYEEENGKILEFKLTPAKKDLPE